MEIIAALSFLYIGCHAAAKIHEWRDMRRWKREQAVFVNMLSAHRSAQLKWYDEVLQRGCHYSHVCDEVVHAKRRGRSWSVEGFNQEFNIASVPPQPIPPLPPIQYVGAFLLRTRRGQ